MIENGVAGAGVIFCVWCKGVNDAGNHPEDLIGGQKLDFFKQMVRRRKGRENKFDKNGLFVV